MSIYKKETFLIPSDLIYLDGNSLGPLTKASQSRIDEVVNKQWGIDLISSWNKHDWFNLPETVGNKIAKILKAKNGSITVCDSTSINLFKVVHAAMQLNERRDKTKTTILTDNLNFPSDLYIAQGILKTINSNYKIKVLDTRNSLDPTQSICDAIDTNTAIVMLTHVGYDTGYAYHIPTVTSKVRECNSVSIWDLSHSVGALDINLGELDVDFAVGCTYKYLNGGPGAPAFLYVHPNHKDIEPTICGWMGQDNPFEFNTSGKSDNSIRKFRVGTPHILNLASLDSALTVFENIEMNDVESTAQRYLELFINGIEEQCPSMQILSPKYSTMRGTQLVIQPYDSQISSYAIMQNLIERKIIGDFRRHNSCRFGIAPLYLNETDIENSVSVLAEILDKKSWNQKKYFTKAQVT